MYYKKRVTVWPNGQVVTSESLGRLPDQDAVAVDMTAERESHGGFASTLSIEETATTLVVVKDTGATHIYNWIFE